MEHGTRKQYKKGCKCDSCKAAEAAYKRDLIARQAASGQIPHGTVQGYVRKCRCEACSSAKAAYERSRIPNFDSADFPHGTVAGSKYGCRCKPCSEAESKRVALWRAKQDYSAVDFPHGSVSGYDRGCKCAQCKVAWNKSCDARREKLDRTAPDFPHGTVKGYRDWCRCEVCVGAITARTSARHNERMAKEPEYVRAYRTRSRVNVAKRRAVTRTTVDSNPLFALIYQHTPEGYEVDHIIPLSKGGLHVPENLQYLPKRINRRKHAKLGYDCGNVAKRWQDLIDEPSTTIPKGSRLQAESKCLTTACATQLKI